MKYSGVVVSRISLMLMLQACQNLPQAQPPRSGAASLPMSPLVMARASSSPLPVATINPSLPVPAATPDLSLISIGPAYGNVYDDQKQAVAGATVRFRSLQAVYPFSAESLTDAAGYYIVDDVPSGIQIEIAVSKTGYTTRRRVEVLRTLKDYDNPKNQHNFGSNGKGYVFYDQEGSELSNKPEVTFAVPGYNANDIQPDAPIVLKFSEPMDTGTVERNFRIRTRAGALNPLRVWDRQAFNMSWNTQQTEVTFSFKPGQKLEWVKDTQPAGFIVSLDAGDGVIRDISGTERKEKPFRLTEAEPVNFYFFDIPYLP